MERRLAAILAADVVGYSRLMEADEAGTLAALKSHRVDLIDPKIAEHSGRVVKLMGDGALVEFASVVDAVACAVAIQVGMAERSAGVPEEQRIAFRIGVHLGDVIVEDDDLYGDGVNIAARLEGLAEANGICISQQALDQVETKLDLSYESLGEQQIKNIARPVSVYRVLLEGEASGAQEATKRRGLGANQLIGSIAVAVLIVAGLIVVWWQPRAPDVEQPSAAKPALPMPEEPSIAVLPFTNMSDDPGQEYFADGMAEDLMTDLSRFPGLFVIARTSSFTYKGKTVDVKQVGQELGVRYVLEGSVRQAGNRVRINAQLVDTTSGRHLWAERFDRDLSDVFAVQDQITELVVGAIGAIGGGRGALQQAELERVLRKPTESLQAYDYFLRGISHIDRLTKEDNLQAREMFQKAIEYDPNYARAYGQLAWTHLVDVYMDFSDSPDESLQTAHQLAKKAVAVDASDPKAHWALATVHHFQQKDDRAIAKYQEALALNPNDADVLAEYGSILAMAGKSEEGLEQVRKAMRLNPYHPEWYAWNLGIAHFAAGQYEEAIAVLTPLTIDALHIHTLLAASYANLDRHEEARAEVAEALRIKPDISLSGPGLGYRSMTDRQAYIDGLRKAGLPE